MMIASKIFGVALVAVLSLAAPFSPIGVIAEPHDLSDAMQKSGPVAACHAHGPAMSKSDIPSPPASRPASDSRTPVNYRCCLTGHDTALVAVSQVVRPVADASRDVLIIDGELRLGSFLSTPSVLLTFADPPGTTPLRI